MFSGYYRPRREGPERELEDVLVSFLPELISDRKKPLWAGGSVPVGAGIPDLLVASFEPRLVALASVDFSVAQILAYLRAVNCARPDTIANKVGFDEEAVIQHLDRLMQVKAIRRRATTYSLAPQWRDVLPEIIAVEIKVHDWRRAISQAGRNRVLAHASYIAVPCDLAARVRDDETVRALGLGVLGIHADDEVSMVRVARRQNPRVWSYYYRLAIMAASCLQEGCCGIQRVN